MAREERLRREAPSSAADVERRTESWRWLDAALVVGGGSGAGAVVDAAVPVVSPAPHGRLEARDDWLGDGDGERVGGVGLSEVDDAHAADRRDEAVETRAEADSRETATVRACDRRNASVDWRSCNSRSSRRSSAATACRYSRSSLVVTSQSCSESHHEGSREAKGAMAFATSADPRSSRDSIDSCTSVSAHAETKAGVRVAPSRPDACFTPIPRVARTLTCGLAKEAREANDER